MKKNPSLLAFAALAVAASTGIAASGASSSAPEERRAPTTVEVKMTNEGGTVRFEPKDITIQNGDTVKWVLAGGSHNVKFWADSVPQGAVDLLKKVTSDSLVTQRYRTVGDTFTIAFAGMPKGTYKYFCSPHLSRGMAASITVQ